MCGFLLLQVGFILKNITLSTHWYKLLYNILHILAVHMANSWLEDIFKCPKKKLLLNFENAVNIFENGIIQNSHNLMLYV